VGDRSDDGDRERRPAPALDAAAGVRALVDVQRRGLAAAGDLVDRLVRAVDGDPDGDLEGDGGPGGAGGPRGAGAGAATSPVDDLVRLWADVVRLGLDTFGQTFGHTFGQVVSPGATVDVATGAAAGRAQVDGGPTEVWLHNPGDHDYAQIRLHCGELRSADGAVLPAAAVRFDPEVVPLPARSSRGVVVSLDSPVDVPAGAYRGVILAAGVPAAWLLLEVVVADGSDGGLRA
jgi:hypothetical protein